MKHLRWLLAATAALVALAGCIPPQPPDPPDPGPGYADNETLMERARGYAAEGPLDIVEFDKNAQFPSPEWEQTWLCGGVTGYRFIPQYGFQAICLEAGLPTLDSEQGSKLMRAVGEYWLASMSFHEQFSGQPFDRGPFGGNSDHIADCFADFHEANPAFLQGADCTAGELDHIQYLETIYPPDDGSAWPPFPWPFPWLYPVGGG